jgi:nucleoside-diphosphate-sugar epimerase
MCPVRSVTCLTGGTARRDCLIYPPEVALHSQRAASARADGPPRRILITGANGFLGTACASEASRRGDHVLLCGRGETFPGWFHYDCRDAASAARLPLDCDAVVHCAGLAHRYPPLAPTDDEYLSVNAYGAAALAQAARARAKRFVLVSSVAALGSEYPGTMHVNATSYAVTPYGRSKLLAERLVAEALAGSGTSLSILRFPAIHGPNAPGAIGHLATWIRAGRPMPACCRSVRRSIIGIDNAVDALLLACHHPGLVDCLAMPADHGTPTVLELASKIASILGVPLRTVTVPRIALRFASRVSQLLGTGGRLSNAAARITEDAVVDDRTLAIRAGWTPPVSLDEGLERALAEIR